MSRWLIVATRPFACYVAPFCRSLDHDNLSEAFHSNADIGRSKLGSQAGSDHVMLQLMVGFYRPYPFARGGTPGTGAGFARSQLENRRQDHAVINTLSAWVSAARPKVS